MLSGYAGKIAWIDLTKRRVRVEELEEEIARKYLGGKGLGAYLLYRSLNPHTGPYDPENKLIFITGPLTGTTFPAVSRSGVVTKSPMTGTFLDSYSGGFFGPHMKYAGYDALVIIGKASNPVYIMVDDGTISIKEAEHLWGLSTSETENRLRNELKPDRREKVSIAAIGQAGERLVRFSNIETDRRAYGRGGGGAVMGSKNLKAIVIRGDGKIPIADKKGFEEIVRRCRRQIADTP